MRKVFLLLMAVATLITIETVYSNKQSKAINELTLQNVEAIAAPEVDIEAICMNNSGMCIIYPNGFFILGQRVD